MAFDSFVLDVSIPCLVLGGRNGAGKSRTIRALASRLGAEGVLVDLHYLCEQALIVLRSRDDFEDMKEEFEIFGPEKDRRADIERIIGREYDAIAWYALEVEPSDKIAAERFRWGGEQSLLPYFEVEYRGLLYTSRDMGLGEFSMHFLFWILEQYRGSENLTLLLDEPDAYLPPIGASGLLARLLKICVERHWKLILTTHSAEMISESVDEKAFVLLSVDAAGAVIAAHSKDDPAVADTLLVVPPTRHVFFVEDESAWILARVLLEVFDRRWARACEIVWGSGAGDLTGLQEHLPAPPRPIIRYAYIFDGDKRGEVRPSRNGRWPALFLPTGNDPDELFRTARLDVSELASRLNVPDAELYRFVESKEGIDPHDWVNDLAERYGRTLVLRSLAELWVDKNPEVVESFFTQLRDIL